MLDIDNAIKQAEQYIDDSLTNNAILTEDGEYKPRVVPKDISDMIKVIEQLETLQETRAKRNNAKGAYSDMELSEIPADVLLQWANELEPEESSL
jgi:hypothetical protein